MRLLLSPFPRRRMISQLTRATIALIHNPILALSFMGVVMVLPAIGQESEIARPTSHSKPQPIPFSHKLHATYMKHCTFCHQISISEGDVSFPSDGKCMQCHSAIAVSNPAIQMLTEHYREKKAVAWVQIYSLPDYVYFSHKVHSLDAKITCDTCHGRVEERDVITKEKSISMSACMDCHRSSNAPVKCNSCHNPNP
jgi:hypothetical protein